MTAITEGMTPAQFITAMNDNSTELVTNWSVDADSFRTLTTSTATPTNINYNLRGSLVSYGQRGGSYIAALNSGFNSTVKRFADTILENIMGDMSGEPSALISDDGNQIDLWATGTIGGTTNLCYTYSTDGTTFAAIVATDIPVGYLRECITKYNGVYYMYTSKDADLYLFTSTDKLHFTNQGVVLSRGSAGQWDASEINNTFVWNEGGNWYMLYEATGSGDYRIGLATALAPEGPWAKYASNPLFIAISGGVGIPRNKDGIIKSGNKYIIYYHFTASTYPNLCIWRAYSTDLVNWTIEGQTLDNQKTHGAGVYTYADPELVEFKGKSYMFWCPTNHIDYAHIDCGIDNRSMAEMLALYP